MAGKVEQKVATDEQFDMVVIGAGLSGLSAACRLQQHGYSVVVLEARDRVGGRTYTVKDKVHGTVDLGGAYVGPSQNRVYRLVREFGLEVYNVNEKEKSVLDIKGLWGKFTGIDIPFRNPFKILDLNNMLRTLDTMAKEVPCEAPWKAKQAKKWDSMSLGQFVDTIVWTSANRDIIDIVVRSVFCVESCEISLLFFLWYVHTGGGIQRMTTITNGAQEKKIVGGSQQLSECMAEKLEGRVHLSCPVACVDHTLGGATVTDCHGNQYKTKYVISAVPQGLINRMTFNPPLPGHRLQLIQRMPMGSIIKTNMFYDRPFWKDLNYNGSAASSSGVCAYCIDDSYHDGSRASIMGFVLGDRGRQQALKSNEERKQALCEHYARVFKDDRFLKPTGYMEYNWMEDQFSGGCYTAIMAPGILTSYTSDLCEPVGRVYFAGTELATIWKGYMDGAIQSGERAANQILCEEGKISASQIYDEEPECPVHPASPIPFSYVEWYLPSVSTLIKCGVAGLVGFMAYSTYLFFFGWKGALLWRWMMYRYDLDESTLKDLTRYSKIPKFWKIFKK